MQFLLDTLVPKLEGWLDAAIAMLPSIAAAVAVVVASSFAARWVEKLVLSVLERMTDNQPISHLLAKIASVATRIVGLFIALGLLQLDKTVTSLLAGVGVIGLALGFAFQDIAANFMSGIFMAIKRPFEPGDLVEVAGRKAVVESVDLRATVVTTLDGLWIQVPNKDVFQNPIINYTKTSSRRMDLAVGVGYGDDLVKAREVAIEAVQGVPGRDPDRDVELFYDGFGDSSINFELRVWLESSSQSDYRRARSEAVIAIKQAFDRANITIPFPIRTLDFGAGSVGGERIDQMQLRVINGEGGLTAAE